MAAGFYTSYVYDTSARPLATQNARGYLTTNVWNARDIAARQDALGNRWSTTYDALDRAVAQTTPLGFTSSSIYDSAGQMVASQDAMGFRTTSSFDSAGNQSLSQDANGLITSFVFASNSNRLAATVDPMGFVTTNLYDLAGQQTGRVNALGNQITMGYDPASRQNLLMNELGFATTTSFDSAGRAVTVLDANGRVKTMSYDAARSLLATQYSDGTISSLQYDALNRLTTATDWAGFTTFSYSKRSELAGKTDPGPLSQGYRYDGVSNRVGLTDPDGGLITSTFDRLDRISSVQKQTGHIYTPQYDADGRRTTFSLGTGIVRTYGLDPLGRLTTQIDYAGASPISTFVDGYDAVGNRVSRFQDAATVYTWTYDNDYRLLGQQTLGGYATFSYDPVYNTTLKWHHGQAPLAMSFDAATRLTTSIQGSLLTTFGFDNAGSRVLQNAGGAVTTSVYDCENRLIQEATPVGLSTYSYQGYNGLMRFASEPTRTPTTLVWSDADYLQERT